MKRRLPERSGAEPEFFSAQVAEARRFYLNLQPPEGTPLAVVCGGLEHCRPDYVIRRQTFPFYSIEYVTRGQGEVRLNGRAHTLGPGSVFAYGPKVAHEITGDPANPLVKYFVDFAGTDALRLLRSCELAPGRLARVFPPSALGLLFDELIESGHGGGRGQGLCVRLLECVALKVASVQAPAGGPGEPAFGTYQQCRNHIERHFLRLHTLEQIAGECHVNNAYLCRLFRRYSQGTPYQYLLRLKMNHAAARLIQSGALVKQVGGEVGFADPFHFSRVFKKVLGLAPETFRRIR